MAPRAPVGDGVVRRDDPRPSGEEVGARGERPATFAAGERVGADVARDVGADVAERVEDPGLHAGDVGHDRIGERGELARDHRGRHVGRHRDDDELRSVVGAGDTTRAEVDGDRDVRRRRIREDHLDAARAEAERDTRAEQAGADDADGPDQA